MQNTTIQKALNGVALAAAAVGDMDTVSQLQSVAEQVTSIVPTGAFAGLGSTFYDATGASSTAFLVFAGLTVGVAGKTAPQFDAQAQTALNLWPTTQPGTPAVWLLHG